MIGILLPLILQLLPQIIVGVEAIFSGAKQGEIKKTVAMNIVNSVANSVNVVKPGTIPQADLDLISNTASSSIDGFVAVANVLGVFKKTLSEDTTPTGIMSSR